MTVWVGLENSDALLCTDAADCDGRLFWTAKDGSPAPLDASTFAVSGSLEFSADDRSPCMAMIAGGRTDDFSCTEMQLHYVCQYDCDDVYKGDHGDDDVDVDDGDEDDEKKIMIIILTIRMIMITVKVMTMMMTLMVVTTIMTVIH